MSSLLFQGIFSCNNLSQDIVTILGDKQQYRSIFFLKHYWLLLLYKVAV